MVRRQIGDYAVLRELAWGERRVCVATRGQARDRYVLVVLEIDDACAIEVEDDVLRAMELDHENVMRPVETFADGDLQVVAYDSPPGITLDRLSHYLAENGEPLSDGAALEIGRQIARGLAAAHTAIDNATGSCSPLVHAELGPHQIFVTWKGQVKILGLGLGAAFRQATGCSDAARAYAAPEVRSGGNLTVSSNAYSAAAIIWSLLSRVTPSVDTPLQPLDKVRSDLDRKLTASIDRALCASPHERASDCGVLAAAIERSRLRQREDLVYGIEIFRALPTTDAAGRPERATTQPSMRSPQLAGFAPSSEPPSSSAPPPSQGGELGAALSASAKPPDSKRTGTLRSMEAVAEPIAASERVPLPEVRVESSQDADDEERAQVAAEAPAGAPGWQDEDDELPPPARRFTRDEDRSASAPPATAAGRRPSPALPPLERRSAAPNSGAKAPRLRGRLTVAAVALLLLSAAAAALMVSRAGSGTPEPPARGSAP